MKLSKKDRAKKRSVRVESEKAKKEMNDFIKTFHKEKRQKKNSLQRYQRNKEF